MQERHLSTFPVEDIWGIGRHSTRKLRALGICTAADLKKINLADVEKLLTITGRRIVEELCGKSCLPLELVTERKKQIISSRSFGKPVFSVNELIEASSYYLSKACEKLRAQGSLCHEIRVFAHTNRFKNVKQYYNTGSLILSEPTASTALLNQAASQIIRAIFKPGIEYKKVGVILNDLISTQDFRPTLFTNKDSNLSQQKLMTTLDDINKRFGQGTIEFAACGIKKPWQMNSKLCSPRYTTCWDDIPTVLAK